VTDASRETKGGPARADSARKDPTQTSGSEWLLQFSEALGVPAPTREEVDALLGLAGIAAHASERTAAPLSTWLVGRSGMAPGDAKDLAARLANTLSPQGEG